MGRPLVMDDKHRVIISREVITTPEEYATRFEELTRSGLAWVNMSCYGVYDGRVLVVIELPEKALEANSPVVTSVNYSGPVHGVSQNGWDVSRVLAIV